MNNIMTKDNFYECISDGFLTFGDIQIPCAVIKKDNDIIRVISNTGMFHAFKRSPHKLQRIDGLPAVIGAHNIAKYISPEDLSKLEEIKYLNNNSIRTGYDAEAITVICDAYLQAESENQIKKRQISALNQAKIILRALARIGINALIDEATGYQYEREFNALQQLLDLYIVDKPLLSLQKKFPRTFYEELFRLYGWSFNPASTKRPKYVGKFTKDYVYNLLPEPVIDRIQQLNPIKSSETNSYRKNKYYQYLTLDTGIPELDKIIAKLVGIMSVSDNINDFKAFYSRAFKNELELKNKRLNNTM